MATAIDGRRRGPVHRDARASDAAGDRIARDPAARPGRHDHLGEAGTRHRIRCRARCSNSRCARWPAAAAIGCCWPRTLASPCALVASAVAPIAIKSGLAGFAAPSIEVLSAPLVIAFFSLVGMRVAIAIPIEPKANWLFRLHELFGPRGGDGRRTGRDGPLGVVPSALLAMVRAAALWGVWPAVVHAGICTLMGLLLVEVLMMGLAKLPFTCTYFPGKSRIGMLWPLYLTGFVTYSYTVAAWEERFFRQPKALESSPSWLARPSTFLHHPSTRPSRGDFGVRLSGRGPFSDLRGLPPERGIRRGVGRGSEVEVSELRRVRPKSRKAWRDWLEKNHASSTGVWLVYAKKHSGLPSLTYNDAVEEALCFGWIDSKINPIDDAFYMQIFTPRKLKSAWSALNKTRVERLLAAGLMTPAGLVVVKAAKSSGTWDATTHVEELTVPPIWRRRSRPTPTPAATGCLIPRAGGKAFSTAWPAPSGPIPVRGTFRTSFGTWLAICPALNAWRGPASGRGRSPRDRRSLDQGLDYFPLK